MNKTELIQEIADKANGSKSEAQRYFEAFEDVVTSALKRMTRSRSPASASSTSRSARPARALTPRRKRR